MWQWQFTQETVDRALRQLRRATAEQVSKATGLKLWRVRDALLRLKYRGSATVTREAPPTKPYSRKVYQPTDQK